MGGKKLRACASATVEGDVSLGHWFVLLTYGWHCQGDTASCRFYGSKEWDPQTPEGESRITEFIFETASRGLQGRGPSRIAWSCCCPAVHVVVLGVTFRAIG